ncbi:MAG: hypothetical protein HXX13_02830 [Bacteroidetes bacterium]|nr:hypothetical protein [Bacteroidota bacterium]
MKKVFLCYLFIGIQFYLNVNQSFGQALAPDSILEKSIMADSSSYFVLKDLIFITKASCMAHQQTLNLLFCDQNPSFYTIKYPGIRNENRFFETQYPAWYSSFDDFNQLVHHSAESMRSVVYQKSSQNLNNYILNDLGVLLYQIFSNDFANHNFNFGRH